MNKLPVFIFLLLFFYACGDAVKKETADTAKEKKIMDVRGPALKEGIIYATELKRGNENAFVDAVGRAGDTIYTGTFKGYIEASDSAGKNRHFILDLKAEYMVDAVFILAYSPGVYFVVWQETDHVGAISYMALFKEGTSKPLWKKKYGEINPGLPVADSSYAYISSLGFIGKVSLDDGSFIWKRDSLYVNLNRRYQRFQAPLVYKNKVVFVDYPVPGRRDIRDTIKVNAASGKIIK